MTCICYKRGNKNDTNNDLIGSSAFHTQITYITRHLAFKIKAQMNTFWKSFWQVIHFYLLFCLILCVCCSQHLMEFFYELKFMHWRINSRACHIVIFNFFFNCFLTCCLGTWLCQNVLYSSPFHFSAILEVGGQTDRKSYCCFLYFFCLVLTRRACRTTSFSNRESARVWRCSEDFGGFLLPFWVFLDYHVCLDAYSL